MRPVLASSKGRGGALPASEPASARGSTRERQQHERSRVCGSCTPSSPLAGDLARTLADREGCRPDARRVHVLHGIGKGCLPGRHPGAYPAQYAGHAAAVCSDTPLMRLSRDERRVIVADLAEQGMSTRAMRRKVRNDDAAC